MMYDIIFVNSSSWGNKIAGLIFLATSPHETSPTSFLKLQIKASQQPRVSNVKVYSNSKQLHSRIVSKLRLRLKFSF